MLLDLDYKEEARRSQITTEVTIDSPSTSLTSPKSFVQPAWFAIFQLCLLPIFPLFLLFPGMFLPSVFKFD